MTTVGTYYSNCSIMTPGCYLYTDPGHTIPAPNGWYVFGGVCYRVYGPGGINNGLISTFDNCDPCPATTTTTPYCLVHGTLITMADGSIIEIQDVKAGDQLLSLKNSQEFYSDAKFELGSSTVTEVNQFSVDQVVNINKGKLVSSLDHIHIIKNGIGWLSMKASLLSVGDTMMDVNGEEFEITSLEIKDEPQNVYQISLDKEHLYFANGVLTHNVKQAFICCDTSAGEGLSCVSINITGTPTYTCADLGYWGPCQNPALCN